MFFDFFPQSGGCNCDSQISSEKFSGWNQESFQQPRLDQSHALSTGILNIKLQKDHLNEIFNILYF
jgi:hypothetical protein